MPPAATALTNTADVQLPGVPSPTTVLATEVLTVCPSTVMLLGGVGLVDDGVVELVVELVVVGAFGCELGVLVVPRLGVVVFLLGVDLRPDVFFAFFFAFFLVFLVAVVAPERRPDPTRPCCGCP
jgi:hypothetical protein